MTWNRRVLLTFITTMAVMLGSMFGYSRVPSQPAEANPAPSYQYCEYSLRGGGSLDPDNDIKRQWDWYENNWGVNIVSSQWSGEKLIESHSIDMKWLYYRANGEVIRDWATCQDYRNDFVGGTYWDEG